MKRLPVTLLIAASLVALPTVASGHHEEAQVVHEAFREVQDQAAMGHETSADEHSDNMSLVANFPYSMGSDLAFWRNIAVAGVYGTSATNNPGGFRLIDISDPSDPTQIGRFECHGPQSDVSIWRQLAFVSVDSPMESEECGAAGAGTAQVAAGEHWEGIRIVSIEDRANPEQIAAVYTDCGSHTHTLVPDERHRDPETGRPAPRVLIYVLSYPLGGQGVDCNAVSHRKISVIEVPLRDPASAQVISTPDVSPAVGCHDVTVFPREDLAAAACITESQMWDISDPANPEVISHIVNPAINIHHSTTFSWDTETLVIGDELGGAAVSPGCLTGGHAPLGALWFYDVSDPTAPSPEGTFVIPQDQVSILCTAHNFNTVPLRRSDRDILVSAWYQGGTTVIDFTDPSNPEQMGFYIPKDDPGPAEAWSSYWYNGHIYVSNFQTARGFDVLEIDHPALRHVRHQRALNPQTQR